RTRGDAGSAGGAAADVRRGGTGDAVRPRTPAGRGGMSEPMPGGRRRVDRVRGEGFLEGLSELSLQELRERRHDAEQEDADLSYIRRLLQGRLDIIRAEIERREQATGQKVVDRLGEVLANEG